MANTHNVISFLFCVLVSFSLASQNGFNKDFPFNDFESRFYNLSFDGKDIIAYGGQFNDSIPGLFGVVIAKIDTNGNLLQTSTLFDPGLLIAETNFSIIVLSNKRIAVVGTVLLESAGFLAIFNQEGSLHLFKKYYSPNILQYYQRTIIEVHNGFLIAGYKQKNNTNKDLDIFIMKVDSEGDKLWEKNYGDSGSNDVLSSIVKVDENTYAIGAGHSNIQNTPLVNTWTQSEIFAIDSIGNIKWAWQSDENIEAGVTGLNQTVEGGWIYCTAVYTISPNQNDWGMQSKIVRRDKNMSELWSKLISPTSLRGNALTDMKPTPDDNWIATGHWITPILMGELNFQGGCLYKISDMGDSIWSRLDTMAWSDLMGSRNALGGVVALPSGSILSAGTGERFLPTPTRDYAWLIKTNANGCIDTTNCTTTNSTEIFDPEISVRVSPNPTNSTLLIEYPFEAQIEIYDSQGKIVNKSKIPGGQAAINVQSLSSGLYFLIIEDGVRRYVKKIILE